MKYVLAIAFILLTFQIQAQLNDEQIRDCKGGRLLQDTSFIYQLPYAIGAKPLFIQGAHGSMSHKDELSFDFKMKKNTKICAARSGVVIALKEDSQVGGLNKKYYNAGNHIIIRHADGSQAMYWHLNYKGVLVQVGDSIKQGKVIGLSGHTGYSAFPHLHFQVVSATGAELLPRFHTRRGIKYLRPGRKYKGIQIGSVTK